MWRRANHINALLTGLLCFAALGRSGRAADTNALLGSWFAAQTNIQTWTSEFVQTRTFKSLTQPLMATGHVWFAAPDRFRWEIPNPPSIAIRRATLTRNAGEDPSLAGFPAVGDVRTNGVSTRISLTNMDPARYPAGCTGVRVSVGGISATGTVTPFAAQAAPLVRATAVNILANGTVAAGSSVDFRVSCVVGGVTHQTRWAGVVR